MMRDLPPEVTSVLERRAERLRQRPPAPTDDTLAWLAEVMVGHQRYALPLDRLRSALPLRAVRSIPLSPPHVIGLLRFHGQLIAALSLASLLGVRGWGRDPGVLIVVEHGPQHQLIALDSETTPIPRSLPAAVVEDAYRRGRGQTILEVTAPDLTRIQLIDLDLLITQWKETVGAR